MILVAPAINRNLRSDATTSDVTAGACQINTLSVATTVAATGIPLTGTATLSAAA